jgi:major membrane immunogen (membrane-anchored lipoprotein)
MTKLALAVFTLVLLAAPAFADEADPTLADETPRPHDHPDDDHDHNDTPFPFVAVLVGLVAIAGLVRRRE